MEMFTELQLPHTYNKGSNIHIGIYKITVKRIFKTGKHFKDTLHFHFHFLTF